MVKLVVTRPDAFTVAAVFPFWLHHVPPAGVPVSCDVFPPTQALNVPVMAGAGFTVIV